MGRTRRRQDQGPKGGLRGKVFAHGQHRRKRLQPRALLLQHAVAELCAGQALNETEAQLAMPSMGLSLTLLGNLGGILFARSDGRERPKKRRINGAPRTTRQRVSSHMCV